MASECLRVHGALSFQPSPSGVFPRAFLLPCAHQIAQEDAAASGQPETGGRFCAAE